jgi:hypothetical protein
MIAAAQKGAILDALLGVELHCFGARPIHYAS